MREISVTEADGRKFTYKVAYEIIPQLRISLPTLVYPL